MNLALLNEAHYLPDTLDANVMSVNNLVPPPTKSKATKAPRAKQEDTGVSCLAYSNHGNYLAAGCHDGRCLIFDFVDISLAAADATLRAVAAIVYAMALAMTW